MKNILLSALITTGAFANECIPLTFSTLCETTGIKVKYLTFKENITTNKQGSLLFDSIAVWNKITGVQLICTYSVSPKIKAVDIPVKKDAIYLWVGKLSKELGGNGVDAHCALFRMNPDFPHLEPQLIHTTAPGKHHAENMTWETFFSQTYFVYMIENKETQYNHKIFNLTNTQ